MVWLKSWNLDTQITRRVIWCGGLLNGRSTVWSHHLKFFSKSSTPMFHFRTILEFLVFQE
ncbi:hypothetical protein Ahy_B09g095496 isoform K [Arachis hypogaea]|uniref:Uncharacterized protein n=1 Tax=Arachis hypogaea TaxID=3818 RepID=A0A444XF01_ARAHY|nr:hypothetical protein Ahy_B09g095496 isoform K [Arachis hypogaea]